MSEIEKLWTRDYFDLFITRTKSNGGELGKLYSNQIFERFLEYLKKIAETEPALSKDIWADCENRVLQENGNGIPHELWTPMKNKVAQQLDTFWQRIGKQTVS